MQSLPQFLSRILVHSTADISVGFLRQSLGTFMVKVAGIGLNFSLTMVLTRFLGVDQFGIYTYVVAIALALSVFAQFGIPNLLIRETARGLVHKDWASLYGVWTWGYALGLSLSFALGAVVVLSLRLFEDAHPSLEPLLLVSMLLIPLVTLMNISGAVLKGLRSVVLGVLTEKVLYQATMIVFVFALVLRCGPDFHASDAIWTSVYAALTATVIGIVMVHRKRPASYESIFPPRIQVRSAEWFSAAWPLALVSCAQQINMYVDSILLGYFSAPSSVAIYRVAILCATFVSFCLQILGAVVTPRFADAFAQSDFERLRRLVLNSSRAAFLTAIPIFLAMWAVGDRLIVLAFGSEFEAAYQPLVWLSLGQLSNSFFGIVAGLLNMTGCERSTLRGMSIAAVCNILLNALLIPVFGIHGAVFSNIATIFVWNIVLWQAVRVNLSIDCMAFGLFDTRKLMPKWRS